MHVNNFNLMRLVLAASVLLIHSYPLSGYDEPVAIRGLGAFAVQCFFVISGYLICASALARKSITDFVWKRAVRILPAFIMAYMLSMFLWGQLGNFANNPTPYIANGSIWTLPWEGICYAIVAFVAAFALLTTSVVNSVYATCLILMLLSGAGAFGLNTVSTNLLFLFLSGAVIKMNEKNLNIKKVGLFSVLFIIFLFIQYTGEMFRNAAQSIPLVFGPDITYPVVKQFFYFALIPYAVIYLGGFTRPLPFTKDDYSYGIYVYAWPVQQTIVWQAMQMGYALTPMELFASASIVTFGLAFMSWHLVERQMLKLKSITRVAGTSNAIRSAATTVDLGVALPSHLPETIRD